MLMNSFLTLENPDLTNELVISSNLCNTMEIRNYGIVKCGSMQ